MSDTKNNYIYNGDIGANKILGRSVCLDDYCLDKNNIKYFNATTKINENKINEMNNKISSKQLCLDDLCINKDQLQDLLNK